MELRVGEEPIGKKLHRLQIFAHGLYIGEYERSQAEHIERKKREIECAKSLLLEIYEKHGEFCVRWDGKKRLKSIRVKNVEVARIPREFWQKPTWKH